MKQKFIIILFYIFNVSLVFSDETGDSLFIQYEKPKINLMNIGKILSITDSINGYHNLKFSILLNMVCTKEGFVKEIKYDKILSLTHSDLKNNILFWKFVEVQIDIASKKWQLDTTKIRRYKICEELLNNKKSTESEYNLCKEYINSLTTFQYLLILNYNNGYSEFTVPILDF